MKRVWMAVVAMLGMGVSGTAMAQQGPSAVFSTELEGSEEVPPVETDAEGFAQVRIRPGAIRWRLVLEGLDDVTRAHIHCAPEGQNGPIGVTLVELAEPAELTLLEGRVMQPDPGNGCNWQGTRDVFRAILNGRAYVNVHTELNPGGELRGQLGPDVD